MEEKSKVVLLPCDSYDEALIYTKIKEGIELLGGIERFVKKEEKILLKPNLVRKAAVERAVITHPTVVGMMARILRENGYEHLSCGDSCGVGQAQKAMKGTGMDTYLKQYDVALTDFPTGEKISYPDGKFVKEFMLASAVCEADAVISLCKMKTHALERITGAVKNQYGCVWGLYKAKGHTLYPTPDTFARMLVDLNRKIRPRLFLMDAVVAMEGNGPTSGDPVDMKLLLLSDDPVALDTVFSRLVHLKPELVPTIYYGNRMGLGTSETEKIQLLTPDGELSMEEAVRRFGKENFQVDRKKRASGNMIQMLKIFTPFQKKPYIDETLCRRCGVCAESCPVEGKALKFTNGRENPPVYDYKKCIRCFCCQEMCPYQAIRVRGIKNGKQA